MASKIKPRSILSMWVQTLKKSKNSSQIYLKIMSKVLNWHTAWELTEYLIYWNGIPHRTMLSKPREQTHSTENEMQCAPMAMHHGLLKYHTIPVTVTLLE